MHRHTVSHAADRTAPTNAADVVVLHAAKLATDALALEAQRILDPLRPRGLRMLRSIDRTGGFVLYEHCSPLSSDRAHGDGSDSDEGELSVDEDVVLQAPVPVPRKYAPPVRITGAASLQGTTLDEFISAFGHRTASSSQSLSPGLERTRARRTIHESKHKRIAVQRLVLPPRGLATRTRQRDFVVVECQKRFVLPDGRAGWVLCLHSVGGALLAAAATRPVAQGSAGDCVRGSVHQTGVVVIESRTNKRSLDVVATAELNLKGNASSGAQRSVSLRRVEKTMAELPTALERRRVELLAFPCTHRFLEAEVEQRHAQCNVCARPLSDGRGLSGLVTSAARRHACRKCARSVCKDCSRVWTLERLRTTTLVGGGRVVTPTRVCRLCYEPSPAKTSGFSEATKPREPQAFRHTTTGPRESLFVSSAGPRPSASTALLRPTQLEFQLSADYARPPAGDVDAVAASSSMRTIRFDRRGRRP